MASNLKVMSMQKEPKVSITSSKMTISTTAEPPNNNSSLFINQFSENFNSLKELDIFYVFVGLSAVIILFFILRAMRFKSKKSSRIRRYGVLPTRGDVEMMPLDNEDDDEDATIFDINDHTIPRP